MAARRKRGPNRPPIENVEETQKMVCDSIGTTTTPITELCKQEGWPSHSQIAGWCSRDASFSMSYAHAKAQRADLLMEVVLKAIDDVDPDSQFGSARIGKARLQADVRKSWAQRLSKDWNAKQSLEVDIPNPIARVDIAPDAEMLKRVGKILQEAGAFDE